MASTDISDSPERTAAMQPTILWHPETQDCGPLSRLLSKEKGVRVLTDRAEAEAQLEAAPEARLLVLHQGPLSALSQAMKQGIPPSVALAQWGAIAQEILDLIRRHRHQVLVLEANAVSRHADAVCELLGLPDGVLDATEDAQPHEEAVLNLLAAQTLLTDLTAQGLADELEASTTDLSRGSDPVWVDADALFHDYRAAQDADRGTADALREELQKQEVHAAKLQKQIDAHLVAQRAAEDRATAQEKALKETESKNVLLLEQVSVMQHEMEHLLTQREQLQQRLDQLNHGMDSYVAQTTELREKLATKDLVLTEKNREISALARNIHTLTTQAAELRGWLDGTRARLHEKQDHIDAIMRSKSYRLTAPLRRIRAATKRKGAGND